MRLYLLPISTRRTLLYAQRLDVGKSQTQTWSEWMQNRVAKTWAGWEKKDQGWQKSVVNYGNYALRRIPYEEWGLKSVPPLSERQRMAELNGSERAEVVYPETLIRADRVPAVLEKLATEREGLHRRKLIWCFLGMPLTAPVALIPLIPNLPFFYLVYRAWSHWRALSGGRHIQFLVRNNLLTLNPSRIMDEVYASQKHPLSSSPVPSANHEAAELNGPIPSVEPDQENPEGETMLLTQSSGKRMTQALDIPQLEIELERAIWQVETAIQNKTQEARADPASSSGPASAPKAVQESRSEEEEKNKTK
ncbi:hypothetical protein VTK73DRAFT_1952 [Phialemonium thermophilum]|uniref:Mitochondrial K+-H+ exchange-related-domain-containing protein n=1 Tax=Phialemonium thermophilum TaxID=223376 RepID=A0ABR3X7I4_9PEZI